LYTVNSIVLFGIKGTRASLVRRMDRSARNGRNHIAIPP
jgi:hypothetical protein